MNSKLFLAPLLMLAFVYGQAQETGELDRPSQDTLSNIVMTADTVFHVSDIDSEIDTLTGNVILTQDSLVMYCDRAIVFDQINVRAYSDVIIIHHDTIQIFADSMRYNGAIKIAELFGEVILQDGEKRLYTNRLLYNVDAKYAEYLTGGTLINEIDTIKSKEGFYYQKDKRVWLKGNVSFNDTTRILKTDSILYRHDIDQLNIVAPTQILQDNVDIYCEGGIYRLKTDRGVLSENVQVKTKGYQITAEILDIKGDENKYTFMIDPKISDEKMSATGDTIVYFDRDGILELRSNAIYRSEEETVRATVITYDLNTEKYTTRGKALVNSEQNIIEADKIESVNDGVTHLSGLVSIFDKISNIRIQSDEAYKEGKRTKLFSNEGQPLLTYKMSSDSLLLLADTLISVEEVMQYKTELLDVTMDSTQLDTSLIDSTSHRKTLQDTSDYDITKESRGISDTSKKLSSGASRQFFYAKKRVRFRNGETFGASEDFVFNQEDSVITLTQQPIIWSDSTQLTGDTIKIYLKNNEVYKISLINNALIVSPDSTGMFNQIKGIRIENIVLNNQLNKSWVRGNAELFYMIRKNGNYQAINLTKSDEMTFIFKNDQISKIHMEGQPESNMYQYEENMDLTPYFLQGFKWRIKERPHPELFVLNHKIVNK